MILQLTMSWIMISLTQSKKPIHPYLCYPNNPITQSNITYNDTYNMTYNYYNKTHESYNTAAEYNPYNLAVKAIWCYDVDVYPKLNKPVKAVIPIKNVQRNDNSDWNIFSIYFSINDNECISPSVSFEYKMVNDDTYFLLNNDEEPIRDCDQSTAMNCGEIERCVNILTPAPIPVDHLYKISIYQYQINTIQSECNSNFAINAKLTFSCSAAAPITTHEPTTTSKEVNRLCTEELHDFNVGAIYYGIGGCHEHFSALLWQDATGIASFSDCLAKCKEYECKSFSFGRKGVSRENWCNIYSVKCTIASDNDWYMFTPINNAELMCNSMQQ
eukprot:498835_1